MNFYPAISLLRHRLLSRGPAGHGVHSPYIYDFLTTGINGMDASVILQEVQELRHEMLAEKRTVMVKDMGSGSQKGMGSKRTLRNIARYCSLPAKQISLLAGIAGYALRGRDDEGVILELGTSLGISALALSILLPERKIITVEGCPVLAQIARQNLSRHGAVNAEVWNMEFSMALNKLKNDKSNVLFAFIDGNHKGSALKEYAATILDMGEQMIIVADDVHLSSDMYQGWKELTEEKKADAFMETKRFGLLFKKANITPGKYKIWC